MKPMSYDGPISVQETNGVVIVDLIAWCFRCDELTTRRLVSNESRNGKRYFTACCQQCGGCAAPRSGTSQEVPDKYVLPTMISKRWIEGSLRIDTSKLPLQESSSRLRTCEHCGKKSSYELHHFAPRAAFGRFADNWPTAQLCRECHQQWHSTLDQYYKQKYAEELRDLQRHIEDLRVDNLGLRRQLAGLIEKLESRNGS